MSAGSMDVCYSGKDIFITGATGFVGKVLVEKILRSLPTVRKLYLLVRPGKKGETPQQRLEKELMGSECFGPLRQALGSDFEPMFREKVQAIGGTLTEHQLGMSDADYNMLCEKVNMIFHLAATIDFDERLDRSVQLNVLGPLRVLALARRCVARGRFDCFVHVSTCYVNFPRRGGSIVQEKIYPLGVDVEETIKSILNWEPSEIEPRTKALLKELDFANTYTFTKSMAERMMGAQRGNVPFCIARPAIIGSAHKEPMPGWVDTLSASGALFLTSGLGLVQEVHADVRALADIVPVDYVVNGLLLAGHKTARAAAAAAAAGLQTRAAEGGAAVAAPPALQPGAAAARVPRLTAFNLSKQSKAQGAPSVAPPAVPPPAEDAASVGTRFTTLERAGALAAPPAPSGPPPVYQFATSGTANPLTWGMVCTMVRLHYQREVPKNKLRPCKVIMVGNRARYEARFHARRTLPVAAYWAHSRTTGKLSPKAAEQAKQADKLSKATRKAYDLVSQFRKFTCNTWTFDVASHPTLYEGLTEDERGEWQMDCHDLTWHVYIARYCYGIHKYVLKQKDAKLPFDGHQSGTTQLLRASL
eukprot:TRINITY_DN11789_c2_g1_i1.p1 TRINITY_DN11789_c2_g1~~TRINITY_DN11789_c2_g1_i1.p1  ORF type:complete len:588 (+),score=177.22 TRINITY_DN11789_c2_g1_i1:96-1859(+)